ncbi:MAG TPA: SO2930 family diheme c-type cytochrome [Chitinophagales bacterium]|nr:SO2930 family diheme c-type cytochrome [Chitinophagales bacterium]
MDKRSSAKSSSGRRHRLNTGWTAGFILMFAILALTSCRRDEPFLPADNVESMPYPNLSDYGFFTGEMKRLEPAARVIPYDLNTPLFSDYAGKARFIYIPAGKQAVYNSDDVFDFPVGTIFIKTFYFQHDLRNPSSGRTFVETRLIIRKSAGWEAASYVWNDSQTEAAYYVAGKNVNVSWLHYDGSTRSTLYHIPNKNECKGCHNDSEILVPIGPKARNINKDYSYSDGVMNQLEKWASAGILSGAPAAAAAPRVPVWDDATTGSLNDRARAYLDINCAHCHHERGPANSSGLLLTYDEANPTALGICKPPVAAGTGSGGLKYNIVPGKPDVSIMIYRMNSAEPDVAMPELARSVIHSEGVQLIRDWIASLPPAGCE